MIRIREKQTKCNIIRRTYRGGGYYNCSQRDECTGWMEVKVYIKQRAMPMRNRFSSIVYYKDSVCDGDEEEQEEVGLVWGQGEKSGGRRRREDHHHPGTDCPSSLRPLFHESVDLFSLPSSKLNLCIMWYYPPIHSFHFTFSPFCRSPSQRNENKESVIWVYGQYFEASASFAFLY